ncbi:hypothetical protein FOL47_000615 [Perkinsus chesapeaki]|uniref:Uncharacterized protein n=1 Tax=Perkinsus chesapeaki TaxID=330153 RepID=A0A7J6MLD2_PERCH|nr:hypothetical protein FOL47_000615 [Perkinsus chesapeaki]
MRTVDHAELPQYLSAMVFSTSVILLSLTVPLQLQAVDLPGPPKGYYALRIHPDPDFVCVRVYWFNAEILTVQYHVDCGQDYHDSEPIVLDEPRVDSFTVDGGSMVKYNDFIRVARQKCGALIQIADDDLKSLTYNRAPNTLSVMFGGAGVLRPGDCYD